MHYVQFYLSLYKRMITKFTGNGLFLTSDTHFCHENILRFCKRPFNSIEEHDKTLIDNWNSVVGPEDTVFHLGDFCFGGYPKWKQIRDQLNGHIVLIRGNHDDKNMTNGIQQLFDYVTYQMRIIVDGRTVYLNHFPFLCFAHGDPNLYSDNNLTYAPYGHVHSGPNSSSGDGSRLNYCYPTQYDVGVDNNNYFPISWKDFDEKINQQLLNWKKEHIKDI